MRLIFTSGPREGQSVDIDRPRLTIGRVDEADVQVPDFKVSREHAVIERDNGGRVVLRDLDSRNGTFVDGVRLQEPRILSGGEELRFGDGLLRVEAPPTPVAPTPVAAPPPVAPPTPDAAPPPPPRRRNRRAAIAAAAAGVIVVLLVVAQLVLPGVAENTLRSDLSKYGPVRQLSITSFPAVKLLWHRANSVKVVMDSYHSEPGGHTSLADFLSQTRATKKLDARVGVLKAQLVTLEDVSLHKDGDKLVGRALLTQRALDDALPDFAGLRPISATQNGIVVRASGTALGQRAAVNLRVQADNGKVVVAPDGLIGSFAHISAFKDPRVYVESFGAELRGDRYLLTVRASLK
jgi:FHA domain